MIGEIEAAILARIEAANQAGLFINKMRFIESVSGKSLTPDAVTAALAVAPGFWIAFLSAQMTEGFGGTMVWQARFAVITIDRHLGGGKQARLGSADTRGATPLAIDAARLLNGHQLGLDIDPLQASSIEPLFNDLIDGSRGAFVAAEFTTGFALASSDAVAGLPNFATFHADYDIEPFLDPAPTAVPLAAGQADATDTVILETLP